MRGERCFYSRNTFSDADWQRCVVLPRDTGRTSEWRYLQPPQKPPLPNVTFYGGPYYGFTPPLLPLHVLFPICFFCKNFANSNIFARNTKLKQENVVVVTSGTLVGHKNATQKIFFAAIVNRARPKGESGARPPVYCAPAPHTLIAPPSIQTPVSPVHSA